ncbi:MAG: YitT family protein [Cyclobacterium sp.]|uniref:YitT family protein n=1 Tax=unclassified Cyclobacterium TaxID=2615055 RepID=UPI0013D57DF1|nr:YitT family protein [Cyclobacterium sp. SYSU L10401]
MQDKKPVNWKSIFAPSSLLYTFFGVGFAVIALRGFMIPNHFLDGGVTGISILVEEIFHINISLLLILFNIPFLIMGYRKIGKTFAIQAAFAVLLLALLMQVVSIPTVTNDKVLIAVFGGIFIGLGIGLVIRGGGVIDGLEVIAHYTKEKSGFSTSEIILTFNSFLFLGAAYEFGIETAMYSILVYYTAMKTSDYVVDGFEEYTSLTIISREHEKIKSLIVNEYDKAITVYKGERGYLPGKFDIKYDCDIVMTIVTRLEIHRIKESVYELDDRAFFFVGHIKEVRGGIVKEKNN